METRTYTPGVCNIGPEEIRKRKQAGWTGLALTAALWAAFIWFDAPAPWRLTLFVPAAMAAMGFIQAYANFCAYFGFASLFNFGDLGKTNAVSEDRYRQKDRRKAWEITIYALLIGVVTALAGYLLS